MKKLFFVIFCAFLMFSTLPAQARLGDFSMRGAASQEMSNSGLVGAHASLPLNSRVKITNPQNGREVEVTIVKRIEPSLNRMIDLSHSALAALQMKPDEQVIITVGAPPRPVYHAGRQSEPIIDMMEPVLVMRDIPQDLNQEPALSVQQSLTSAQQPVIEPTPPAIDVPKAAAAQPVAEDKNIPVLPATPGLASNSEREAADLQWQEIQMDPYYPEYVIEALKDPSMKDAFITASSRGKSAEFLAWLMAMSIEAREARDSREARLIREEREIREAREMRDAREAREAREIREAREARMAREEREIREAREARMAREEREAREARRYREMR